MSLRGAIRPVLGPVYRGLGGPRIVHYVQTRRFWFERERRRYFAEHVLSRRGPADDPEAASLIENGVLVLSGLHDPALVKRVHDQALAAIERVRRDEAPSHWKTVVYRNDGIYRVHALETLVPEAQAILDHPIAHRIVHAYLGPRVRSAHNYLDYKPDTVHDDTSVPHFDSFKSQLKIFTLLSDVTAANAPLVYWKKSHRDGDWRAPIDYLLWSGDYIGSGGVVPPHVLRDRTQLKSPQALEETEVTGAAGTAIFADTRGAHRASNLREGYRLQIVQKFTVY
jgi:hypothetical protein